MRQAYLGTFDGDPDIVFLTQDQAELWRKCQPSNHKFEPIQLEDRTPYQMSAVDLLADNMGVEGKGCNGCIRTKRDIMIWCYLKDDPNKDPIDLFLTQEQAEKLYNELGKQIGYNKENYKELKSGL